METFIKNLSEITSGDIAEVGTKNASLGEMYNNLVPKGIQVPEGFAITTAAYSYFLGYNGLEEKLDTLMKDLDTKEFSNLGQAGAAAHGMIMGAKFPPVLENAIITACYRYFGNSGQEVAVRSSAVPQGMENQYPDGLYDSFLNIKGPLALAYAIKCCFASLYSDKAVKYRVNSGSWQDKLSLSVGVQRMVRSDLACSGIGSIPEVGSGGRDAVHLAGSWGLGEYVMQGTVTPDEFVVSGPDLVQGTFSISKNLGSKNRMLTYKENAAGTYSTLDKTTPWEFRMQFVLSDSEIGQLAQWALLIEDHYGTPMDFEWAKDGVNQLLYLIGVWPRTGRSPSLPKHYFPGA